MSSPTAYTWVRGRVLGYAPAGDSVRVVPDELATLRGLENGDAVEVDGRRTTLSDLVTQEGDEVRLPADPLALVFIE